MADFYQHARLPTLHHLATPDPDARNAELAQLVQARPLALLLPALFAEVDRPALPAILQQVAEVPYVSDIVLSMNGMRAAQLPRVRELCAAAVPNKHVHILWNDGPELEEVNRQLDEAGLGGRQFGKGANIWMGLAYLKALGRHRLVVSHDTDILNYTSGMLAKLTFPIAHPKLPYRFAKGYYSRVAGRLYGRVTRLLIFPLIQAFQEVMGPKPLLSHLDSFRYPLSGEFAGDIDTVSGFTLPHAWGLEIAMLCEAYRHVPAAEQCQVDLGLHFEHRHRQLSPSAEAGGREEGLVAAAADVIHCLAIHVLSDADELAAGKLLTRVLDQYRLRSVEWMERYEHVALLNGLDYDRADESAAVAAFTEALIELSSNLSSKGLRMPGQRPAPAQTLDQMPGIGKSIVAAALSLPTQA